MQASLKGWEYSRIASAGSSAVGAVERRASKFCGSLKETACSPHVGIGGHSETPGGNLGGSAFSALITFRPCPFLTRVQGTTNLWMTRRDIKPHAWQKTIPLNRLMACEGCIGRLLSSGPMKIGCGTATAPGTKLSSSRPRHWSLDSKARSMRQDGPHCLIDSLFDTCGVSANSNFYIFYELNW